MKNFEINNIYIFLFIFLSRLNLTEEKRLNQMDQSHSEAQKFVGLFVWSKGPKYFSEL